MDIMIIPTSSCELYYGAEHTYFYEYANEPSPVELADELEAKQVKSKKAIERQTKQARSKRFVPRF